MIVILLMGIGIGLLVLMQGKGDTRPASKETAMTTARIRQMLADDEQAKRARRSELRRPSGTTKVSGRRQGDVRGNRGNQRASFAREW